MKEANCNSIKSCITHRWALFQQELASCCLIAQRSPQDIKILLATKHQPIETLKAAFDLGLVSWGENYVQELISKTEQFPHIEWHFIGHLQRNKTREVANRVSFIHTLDSLVLARRLNDQRPVELPPLNVCIQVKLDDEDQKSGVYPDQVLSLAQAIHDFPRLQLRGLMTLPVPREGIEAQRQSFAQLRQLRDELIKEGISLDTLSMGTSHDWQAAVLEGSTCLRMGSLILGDRHEIPG